MTLRSHEGSDASLDQAVTEVSHRLDQLQSFIWWTVPLYLIFAGVGLYETHFNVTLAFLVLLAVLAAFGFLDGVILVSLQGLRNDLSRDPEEVLTARERLERLSRTVLLGGAAFGITGLAAVLLLAFQ